MPSPQLVVTVAAPSMAELRRLRDAVPEGADLVELRLDLVRDPDVQGALADRRKPVIVTCRAKWEGGSFAGSEAERKAILVAAVQQKREGDYVDVEFKADFAKALIAETNGKGIVLSSHDFEGVPSDFAGRLRAMRSAGAEITKIAVMPGALSDNLTLLEAERAEKTVLIGMGPSGIPTRVLAAHFNSCWSYAGDGHAPGQLSASRMLDEFGFRRVSNRTHIYGVVGTSVTHSMSPAMHNAVFRSAGVDAVYVPFVASSAGDFMGFANALGIKGASVTIPFKVDLFHQVADIDDLGRRVGAINTLRRDGNGWSARNTDVSGFLAPLADRLALSGARAAILGTGGAARAVAVALGSAGCAVTVYGRNSMKANDVATLAGGLGAPFPVARKSWDVLVNATPLGMYPNVDETPFEQAEFDGRLVYDLVYNPTQTRLLTEAAAAGCDTIGGLDMLIAQAEDQSEWWIGRRAPADVMRRAVTL